MTCPGTYPTVLNGQMSNYTNVTAEFECLTGFYMSGSKVIKCTGAGQWGAVPTCTVIRQYDEVDVYPTWWFYVLGAILGLMALTCLLCLLCWWCCGRPSNTVQPYEGYSDGRGGCGSGCGLCCLGSRGCCGGKCCRGQDTSVMETGGGRSYSNFRTPVDNGGVYFIPANGRPPEGGNGFRVYHSDGLLKLHVKDQSTSTDTKQRMSTVNGHRISNTSQVNGGTFSKPQTWADGDMRHSLPASEGSPRNEASNNEAHNEGDMTDRKYKKPAKEVKEWLPHSHPVRLNHNTSTK